MRTMGGGGGHGAPSQSQSDAGEPAAFNVRTRPRPPTLAAPLPKDAHELHRRPHRPATALAGQAERRARSCRSPRSPIPEPGPDEVLVRVEAAPINPSDLGLLFAAADMTQGGRLGHAPSGRSSPRRVPEGAMKAMAGRARRSRCRSATRAPAWSSPPAARRRRRRCSARPSPCSAARCMRSTALRPAEQCLLLPAGATPAEGASCFVNPLTALGMVETMRREGHTALVHTAAASNLGQMLKRICLDDGVGAGEHRAQARAGGAAARRSAPSTSATRARRLHRRPDRGARRDRRDARVRRDRRRQAGRPDPGVHGSGAQPQREGIQPLRLDHAQAGLHLRRPRQRRRPSSRAASAWPGAWAAGC